MTQEEQDQLKDLLFRLDTGNYKVKIMVELIRRALCIIIKQMIKDVT